MRAVIGAHPVPPVRHAYKQSDYGDNIAAYYVKQISEGQHGNTWVASKGQVTISKNIRQQPGIRQGSRIEFALAGDHVEVRVKSSPTDVPDGGFGMLKSHRAAAPADLDPATLEQTMIGIFVLMLQAARMR